MLPKILVIRFLKQNQKFNLMYLTLSKISDLDIIIIVFFKLKNFSGIINAQYFILKRVLALKKCYFQTAIGPTDICSISYLYFQNKIPEYIFS